ncbi:hypothetical protein OHB04_22750 [Streptomyces sp. NBC_01775]|uniref:hypothetical protein n=1 Tax=Streptomyces sp. NBC_01775 TaxID=2975939 RepID=UPI002DDB7AE9|nr:hypothetical protein [Streptomyces sp. NBC_01775]WSB78314.1 hypothetical protein OHB04_22750 [Streptomyces sp. NBC_01775]
MPGEFEAEKLHDVIDALKAGDHDGAAKAMDHLLLESDDPDAVAALIQRETDN